MHRTFCRGLQYAYPPCAVLINYKNQYEFKGVNISIVDWPDFMSIDNLSDTTKQRVINLYSAYPDNTYIKQLSKNIKLNNKFPTELQKYFAILDKTRNLKHTDIFPWLYE
jgi:hypothetical protein